MSLSEIVDDIDLRRRRTTGTWTRNEYDAGEIAPETGRYYPAGALGRPAGITRKIERGAPFPLLPFGIKWRPETATALRTRAEELRQLARTWWPQAQADELIALAGTLDKRASGLGDQDCRLASDC